MAPRESESGPSPRLSPVPPNLSIWKKIMNVPLVQKTCTMYVDTKDNSPLLKAGLDRVEKAVCVAAAPTKWVLSTVAKHLPKTVSKLDDIACNMVTKVESAVTTVSQVPAQTVRIVKTVGQKTLKFGIRSLPGRVVMRILDTSIQLSQRSLRYLDNSSKDRRAMEQSVKNVISLSVSPRYMFLVLPNRTVVAILCRTKQIILSFSGLKDKNCSKSSSKSDIEKRKKVSPKKKLNRTYVVQGLYSLAETIGEKFGLLKKSKIQFKDDQDLDNLQESKDEGSTKRKRDDVEEEEDDHVSEVDLQELLTNDSQYISDEDSDYDPEKDPDNKPNQDETLEYHEGDTESDIEASEDGRELKVGDNLARVVKETDLSSMVSRKRKSKRVLNGDDPITSTPRPDEIRQAESKKSSDSTKAIASVDQSEEEHKELDDPEQGQEKVKQEDSDADPLYQGDDDVNPSNKNAETGELFQSPQDHSFSM